MPTRGAATKTPSTPKAATHKSMEKITASEWSFMLCAMIRGEITLFSKACTVRYASKIQTGSHASFTLSEQEGRHRAQDGSQVGNRFEDRCDQPRRAFSSTLQNPHLRDDWIDCERDQQNQHKRKQNGRQQRERLDEHK